MITRLRSTLLFIVLFGVFSSACGGTAPPPSAATAEVALPKRIDAALDAAVRDKRVVGAVLLVSQDGQLVYHRAVGLADREQARPMREDAIFLYASMTKPIVATAALALIDSGALTLDDLVTQHLPDFKPKLSDGSTPAISVRQLLTHTSGLGYGFTEAADGPYHKAGVSDGLDMPGRSFADNSKRLVSVPLRAAPGTAFHYSLSIDVLGEVIAHAGGASLPELVALLVTQPLHLSDTAFRVVDPARLVTPYADGADGPIPLKDGQSVPLGDAAVTFAPSRIKNPDSYPSGGAGMAGTAHDFLTFLEALRTNGVGLKPETLEALARDQLGDADSSELGPGKRFGFASSILVDPAAAKSVANPGTLRWGGAYGHSWWVDRDAKLSVVLLTNTTFEGMVGQFTRDVEHAVYGR